MKNNNNQTRQQQYEIRSIDDLPTWLRAPVASELYPGEHLVWVQRPKPTHWNKESTAAFAFSIPWTAFSLFWMAGASGFQIPDFSEGWGFFPLFGLPFVVIGVGLMTSPLRTYRSTQRSVCAITNQRALLIEVSGKKTSVKSFFPDRLAQGHIYREDKTNGLSDVMFASETTTDSDGDAKTCPLGFENIPDGRTAETLLHELARVQRCAA